MKTTALLALALTGITVQAAQPAAAPPPLAAPPSFPTIPPRTNRLASPSAATNLVPSRPARTNLVGLPTNTPAVTGAVAGTVATNLSSLTNALAAANTNVTALTNALAAARTNVTALSNLIGAAAARTNVVPLTNAVASAPRTNIIPATIPPPITPPPSIPTIVPPTPSTVPPGTTVIGAAGPGAAGAVGPAGANPPGANGPELDILPPGLIKFQDADIALVLELYQDLTGRTVMKPNNLPATKISIRTQTALTRKEAIDALNTILAMNQITMINQGEKFVKAVPQAQALTEAEQFNELPGDELNETTRYITQIVQLKNAMPKEVAPALAPLARMPGNGIMAIDSSGILVIRDYEENVKRMLELLEKIDVVPSAEFEPIVIPIKYALAADIAQVLGSLTAGGGGGGVTVGRQPNRSGLSTGGGGGFGQQGGLGGMGGASYPGGGAGYNPANPLGGAQGAGGFGTGGGFGSQNAGRSSFADRLRSIVNRTTSGAAGDIAVIGNTKIIADERTNSLLIFAGKEDIKTIKDIIAKLDVVLPQVLIEAIIVEVALDDELKYGFSYLQPPQTSGKFSGLGAINNGQPLNFQNFGTTNNVFNSGFSYLAKWNNDLWVSFEAVANDSRLNVLSRPRIQTSHAVEANLFVGETRPYITSSYAGYPGYGSGAGYSQYSQLQIGITLSVLPLINPDGLVVMDIRQKIQSIGKEVIIDGNPVPSTIDREANAKVSVHDKETVILGGFISSERQNSASGVPFLKDLPLLGALFRTQDKKNARRELIVLIRPTVLPTPEIAASAAREETSKMPGVSAAQKDYNDSERKRLEKVQRDISKDAFKKEGFAEPKNQNQ